MSIRLIKALKKSGLHNSIRVVKKGYELGVKFQLREDTRWFDYKNEDSIFISPIDGSVIIDFVNKTIILFSGIIFSHMSEHEDAELSCILIHELGHICATNKNPNECTEYNFIGWELSKELCLEADYRESLTEFGLGYGAPKPLPPTNNANFTRFLEGRKRFAIKQGLLSKKGKILSKKIRNKTLNI